jgi:hypothetical protein
LLDLPPTEPVRIRQRRQDDPRERAEAAGEDALGQGAASGLSRIQAGQAFEPELVDERLDLGEVGDLLVESAEVIAAEGMSATPTGPDRQSVEEPSFAGGTRGRWCLG